MLPKGSYPADRIGWLAPKIWNKKSPIYFLFIRALHLFPIRRRSTRKNYWAGDPVHWYSTVTSRSPQLPKPRRD
jgi:hypothetical protein